MHRVEWKYSVVASVAAVLGGAGVDMALYSTEQLKSMPAAQVTEGQVLAIALWAIWFLYLYRLDYPGDPE